MVESPDYSTNFAGFDKLPVTLPVAHRLVYSPHAYYGEGQNLSSFDELKQAYEARATFLLHTEPANSGVGRRVRRLPDPRLRREFRLAEAVCPVAQRESADLVELLASQWHAIQRRRAQV